MSLGGLFRAKKRAPKPSLHYDANLPEKESEYDEDGEIVAANREYRASKHASANSTSLYNATSEEVVDSGGGEGIKTVVFIMFMLISFAIFSPLWSPFLFGADAQSGKCSVAGSSQIMEDGSVTKLYNVSDLVTISTCTSQEFLDALVGQAANISSLVILGLILTVIVGLIATVGTIFTVR